MWSPMTGVIHNGIEFGFTRVRAFASLEENVCNPLADLRELEIEEVLISVQRPGSNKVVATCQYLPPVGRGPIFLTDPVPLLPLP